MALYEIIIIEIDNANFRKMSRVFYFSLNEIVGYLESIFQNMKQRLEVTSCGRARCHSSVLKYRRQ